MAQANYIGRRKNATARLYIEPGKGEFQVNKRDLKDYFSSQARINIATRPLTVTEKVGDYDIKVTVKGGGTTGQAGAIQLALARALDDLHEDVHSTLKKESLLTRDDRMVERKKYGQPKARKKFQFSKR